MNVDMNNGHDENLIQSYYADPAKYLSFSHTTDRAVNYSIDLHFHLTKYEIFYFLSGDVEYFIGNKTYKLNPGNLLLINSRQLHRPLIRPGKEYQRITIHFDPIFFRAISPPDYNLLECFEAEDDKKRDLIHLSHDSEFISIMNRLEERFRSKSPGDLLGRLSAFIDLLLLINQYHREQDNPMPIKDMQKIAPILEYINNNLGDQISIDQLAKKFYISKYYLSRLFKRNTGFTLYEYLINKRILLAKDLISQGVPLGEVSERVGFTNYSNFYRAFKSLTGISPREYKALIK